MSFRVKFPNLPFFKYYPNLQILFYLILCKVDFEWTQTLCIINGALIELKVTKDTLLFNLHLIKCIHVINVGNPSDELKTHDAFFYYLCLFLWPRKAHVVYL